jgi:hypothetical protein
LRRIVLRCVVSATGVTKGNGYPFKRGNGYTQLLLRVLCCRVSVMRRAR